MSIMIWLWRMFFLARPTQVLVFGSKKAKGAIVAHVFEPQPYGGWTKSISHHFETMKSHCLLVFARESSFPGFLGEDLATIHRMSS